MPSMHMSQKGLLRHLKNLALQNNKKMKAAVLHAAGGGAGNDSVPVVELEDDGKSSRPGPAAKSYERSRAAAGGHLLFNAFWLVSTFCIYQMYMRDSLHQVDHGIIVHVLRGILRLFFGKNTKHNAL
jgi:hypothetical protein